MGISRSSTVVITYPIATTNMMLGEALTSVQSKRAIVLNHGFMSQLQEYYSKCSNSLLQAKVGDELGGAK